MPSSVVVFHIYQRLVASVKILAQQNSLLGQVERRRSVFGFDIFELGNGRNAFGKMENSGRFGRVEAKGFILVKKAEREFIKRLSNSLPFTLLKFKALPCGSVNCIKALSISFKILSDLSWLSAETRILKLADTSGWEAFSSIILARSSLAVLSFSCFFHIRGRLFWEEESEKIKSPMKEKMPVPVILAFSKLQKVFSLFLFLRRSF